MAMPISRPFLIALIGAVLLGATFFAFQNMRDNSGDDAAPAAQQPAPGQQDAAPAASPEELLQAAFKGGEIDSAAFSAQVSIDAEGQRADLDVSGAFEQGAVGDIPEFEVSAQLAAPGQRFEGGFTSLGDKAFFTQGDTGWRVPDEVWSPVAEAVAKGAGAQPQNLSLPVDPQSWIRDVESEGTESLDGVETTHVSASVDSERVVRDLFAAARATGRTLPDAASVASAVEDAEFDAWIGTDDRVLRRVTLDVAVCRARRALLRPRADGRERAAGHRGARGHQPGHAGRHVRPVRPGHGGRPLGHERRRAGLARRAQQSEPGQGRQGRRRRQEGRDPLPEPRRARRPRHAAGRAGARQAARRPSS